MLYRNKTASWAENNRDRIFFAQKRIQTTFNHEEIPAFGTNGKKGEYPIEGKFQIASRKIGDEIVTLVTPAAPGTALTQVAKLLEFESLEEQNDTYLEKLDTAESFCFDLNNDNSILNIRRFFRRFERAVPHPHPLGHWKMFSLNDLEGIPLGTDEILKIKPEHLPQQDNVETELFKARMGDKSNNLGYDQKDEPYILWTEEFDGITFNLVQDGISPLWAQMDCIQLKEPYERIMKNLPDFLKPSPILIHLPHDLWARSYANVPKKNGRFFIGGKSA